jgi:asparagine synthase (glutamine-hydrolysing)
VNPSQTLSVAAFAGLLEPGPARGRATPAPRGCNVTRRGEGFVVFAEGWSGAAPPVPPAAFSLGSPPWSLASESDALALPEAAGSYAACRIQPERGRIALARDPAGSRRLYVFEAPGFTAFASDLDLLRDLLEARSAPLLPDATSLFMFLEHLHIPAPFTPWRDAQQLLPGERRDYSLETGRRLSRVHAPRRNPRLADSTPGLRGGAALDALDAALHRSLEAQLVEEPASGILLSGGKDSSSLLLACPEGLRAQLHCLTVSSSDGAGDESEVAARLARDLGHPCHVMRPTPETMLTAIRERVARFESPIGDPSAVALASFAQEIAARCGRVLDGTGNDSSFGIPVPERLRRLALLRRLPFKGVLGRLVRDPRIRPILRPPHRFFLNWDGLIPGVDCAANELSADRWEEALGWLRRDDLVVERTETICLDWEPCGPYYRTAFLGRTAGLPVDFPWLGEALSQAVLSLDRSELLEGATNKLLLRRWLQSNAPSYVLEKPKGYLHIPLSGVLELRRAELEDWARRPEGTRLAEAGLPPAPVQGALRQWLQGERSGELVVWAVLLLEEWLRAHP